MSSMATKKKVTSMTKPLVPNTASLTMMKSTEGMPHRRPCF